MQEHIKNIININGYIPLDDFVYNALMHPRYGYYSTQNPIQKDFTTSPEITNAFGIVVANYLMNKILQIKNVEGIKCFNIVELGGGSGKLAFDVLTFLCSLKKLNNVQINSVLEGLHFHFVECSPVMQKMQKQRLQGLGFKCSVCNTVKELNILKKEGQFVAFICNEFFDALPVKQFVVSGKEVFEVAVVSEGGGFGLSKVRVSNDRVVSFKNFINNEGIIEIPFVGLNILEEIALIMQKNPSLFLMFDYGHNGSVRKNTLQGIYNGKKTKDILKNVGRCDITHLVNFGIFMDFFQKKQMQCSTTCQSQFLLQNGIGDLVKKHNQEGIERITSGMAGLFKTLSVECL